MKYVNPFARNAIFHISPENKVFWSFEGVWKWVKKGYKEQITFFANIFKALITLY